LNYTYIFDGGELECELEYVPAESGSREHGVQMEPDYPEGCSLETATLNGVDIAELLSSDVIGMIETKALAQTEDF
jgi:hypothetical protein